MANKHKNKSIEPEEVIAQETTDYEEVTVAPTAAELVNQLKGMKELFVSMIGENKREYNRQVSDMKKLFVDLLEENKKAFQGQLTYMQQNLPKVLETSLAKVEIPTAKNQESKNTSRTQNVEEASTLKNIKSILAGDTNELITEEIQNLQEALQNEQNQQLQALEILEEEIAERLQKMDALISQEIMFLQERIQGNLTAEKENFVEKNKISSLVSEIMGKLK